MDKQRVMRSDSIKKSADSFIIRGDFLFSYSKYDDRITLEMYDFDNLRKTIMVVSEKASKDFPGIWDIEDSFSKMDYVVGAYDSRGCVSFPIENIF